MAENNIMQCFQFIKFSLQYAPSLKTAINDLSEAVRFPENNHKYSSLTNNPRFWFNNSAQCTMQDLTNLTNALKKETAKFSRSILMSNSFDNTSETDNLTSAKKKEFYGSINDLFKKGGPLKYENSTDLTQKIEKLTLYFNKKIIEIDDIDDISNFFRKLNGKKMNASEAIQYFISESNNKTSYENKISPEDIEFVKSNQNKLKIKIETKLTKNAKHIKDNSTGNAATRALESAIGIKSSDKNSLLWFINHVITNLGNSSPSPKMNDSYNGVKKNLMDAIETTEKISFYSSLFKYKFSIIQCLRMFHNRVFLLINWTYKFSINLATASAQTTSLEMSSSTSSSSENSDSQPSDPKQSDSNEAHDNKNDGEFTSERKESATPVPAKKKKSDVSNSNESSDSSNQTSSSTPPSSKNSDSQPSDPKQSDSNEAHDNKNGGESTSERKESATPVPAKKEKVVSKTQKPAQKENKPVEPRTDQQDIKGEAEKTPVGNEHNNAPETGHTVTPDVDKDSKDTGPETAKTADPDDHTETAPSPATENGQGDQTLVQQEDSKLNVPPPPKAPPPPPKQTNPQGEKPSTIPPQLHLDMMELIRQGVKLRKVVTKPDEKKATAPQPANDENADPNSDTNGDLFQILAKRREGVVSSETDDDGRETTEPSSTW